MSDMGMYAMEQDERENFSGADDYEAWIVSIEGSYLCPYCGTISPELRTCCGEVHSVKICDMNEEAINIIQKGL